MTGNPEVIHRPITGKVAKLLERPQKLLSALTVFSFTGATKTGRFETAISFGFLALRWLALYRV